MKLLIILSILFAAPQTKASSFDLNEDDSITTDANLFSDIPSTIEPILNNNLILLGRGLQNRKTQESIALICTSENCSTLRMGYFDLKLKKSYYFGNPIVINADGSTPTELQIKKTLKNLIKEFKKTKTKNGEKRTTKAFLVASLVPMISVLLIAYTGPLGIMIASGGASVGLPLFLLNQSAFFTSDKMMASFNDIDGWNWSTRAKKISNENFDAMIKANNINEDDKNYNINFYRSQE